MMTCPQVQADSFLSKEEKRAEAALYKLAHEPTQQEPTQAVTQ